LAAGVYPSEAPSTLRFLFLAVKQFCSSESGQYSGLPVDPAGGQPGGQLVFRLVVSLMISLVAHLVGGDQPGGHPGGSAWQPYPGCLPGRKFIGQPFGQPDGQPCFQPGGQCGIQPSGQLVFRLVVILLW
jgi:hypothetical protein